MANLALAHLSEASINAFDNTTKAGRWFKQFYAPKRDAFQAAHYWNFAMKLVALAPDTDTPAFRFNYQYSIPSDCLRILPITYDGKRDGTDVTYEVYGNKILTDKETVLYIQYVSRIEEESMFDPLFVEAFSYHLAAHACHPITGKNSLKQTLEQMTQTALDTAAVADAMQGTPYPNVKSDYISIRSERW